MNANTKSATKPVMMLADIAPAANTILLYIVAEQSN
jgi:hypothetical protein